MIFNKKYTKKKNIKKYRTKLKNIKQSGGGPPKVKQKINRVVLPNIHPKNTSQSRKSQFVQGKATYTSQPGKLRFVQGKTTNTSQNNRPNTPGSVELAEPGGRNSGAILPSIGPEFGKSRSSSPATGLHESRTLSFVPSRYSSRSSSNSGNSGFGSNYSDRSSSNSGRSRIGSIRPNQPKIISDLEFRRRMVAKSKEGSFGISRKQSNMLNKEQEPKTVRERQLKKRNNNILKNEIIDSLTKKKLLKGENKKSRKKLKNEMFEKYKKYYKKRNSKGDIIDTSTNESKEQIGTEYITNKQKKLLNKLFEYKKKNANRTPTGILIQTYLTSIKNKNTPINNIDIYTKKSKALVHLNEHVSERISEYINSLFKKRPKSYKLKRLRNFIDELYRENTTQSLSRGFSSNVYA